MALELVAAICLGIGLAGVATLLRKLAPGVIPRFIIPLAAGAGILGFTIWNEYSWFERETAGLPPGVTIASTYSDASLMRPWTYAAPFVSRFMAIDEARARRHADAPGMVIVDVYLFQRYTPTANLPVLIDCASARRADIVDGAVFADNGQIEGAYWRDVGPADPLVGAVCTAT